MARLREVARERPLLLLAHAFTQHTAGLSGGRVVKRMARKYMGLPEDQGGCRLPPCWLRRLGCSLPSCVPDAPRVASCWCLQPLGTASRRAVQLGLAGWVPTPSRRQHPAGERSMRRRGDSCLCVRMPCRHRHL